MFGYSSYRGPARAGWLGCGSESDDGVVCKAEGSVSVAEVSVVLPISSGDEDARASLCL